MSVPDLLSEISQKPKLITLTHLNFYETSVLLIVNVRR